MKGYIDAQVNGISVVVTLDTEDCQIQEPLYLFDRNMATFKADAARVVSISNSASKTTWPVFEVGTCVSTKFFGSLERLFEQHQREGLNKVYSDAGFLSMTYEIWQGTLKPDSVKVFRRQDKETDQVL